MLLGEGEREREREKEKSSKKEINRKREIDRQGGDKQGERKRNRQKGFKQRDRLGHVYNRRGQGDNQTCRQTERERKINRRRRNRR